MREAFDRSLALGCDPSRRVEVPYGDGIIAGVFHPAATGGPAPCMIFVNCLDGTKEIIHRCGIAQALARRGVATLMVDQPGVGEALRLHGLTATPRPEEWAAPIVDRLLTMPEVRPDAIGIMGWSLGGYYAPRIAAFEPRLSLLVAWGANYDWGGLQHRRLYREGENPVAHYWEHVRWVWGAPTMEAFMALTPEINLEGVLGRITAPALVVHGENNRQIPVADAHRTYDELMNSRSRELRIFGARDGGVEHVNCDMMDNARDFIADWIAEAYGLSSI